MFQPVVVPGQGEDPTPDALLAEIGEWLHSEPLQALIRHFGGQLPGGHLTDELDYLDTFTAKAWNFRRSGDADPKERNQVDPDAVTGPDEELAVAAAEALGLVRPRPPQHHHYDHLVMLGGLVQGNVWRTSYAAHLLKHGVTADDVTAISAYRTLARNDEDPGRDELKLLETFALPHREYEWEVMEDSLRRAFGLPEFTVDRESGPSADGPARFRVAWAESGGRRVSLVVAPSPDPGRRANTGDGYRYWAGQMGQAKPGDRILAVTTCIYVPYQHAVALQYLAIPFGCSVDTVGIDFAAIGDDPNPQRFRGAHYLLDIRSALLAYQRLVGTLARPGNPAEAAG